MKAMNSALISAIVDLTDPHQVAVGKQWADARDTSVMSIGQHS
jgi:hypothetical protein